MRFGSSPPQSAEDHLVQEPPLGDIEFVERDESAGNEEAHERQFGDQPEPGCEHPRAMDQLPTPVPLPRLEGCAVRLSNLFQCWRISSLG